MIALAPYLKEKALLELEKYKRERGEDWSSFSMLDIGDDFYLVKEPDERFLKLGIIKFEGMNFLVCQKIG